MPEAAVNHGLQPPVRVAIVDDHPIVRRGLVATLREAGGLEVVAEGASSADAERIITEFAPDLILLDVTMPGGGLAAAEAAARLRPSMAVVMLTIREDLATVKAALQAGARGYVSKGVAGEELIAAVRRVLAGERFVSPELAARLLTGEADKPTQTVPGLAAATAPLHLLTERERQIFDLLSEGLGNQGIADRLSLSENTVKHYMTPLLQKLGLRSRTEAALLSRSVRA